jgi:potassium efflux system protein
MHVTYRKDSEFKGIGRRIRETLRFLVNHHIIRSGLLIIALFFVSASMASDETTVDSTGLRVGVDTSANVTLKQVESALEKVEGDAGIDDAVKDLVLQPYKEAIEALKEKETFAANAAEYRAALKTAPNRTAELRTELKALPSVEHVKRASSRMRNEDLQKVINVRRAELKELIKILLTTKSDLNTTKLRPFEISSRLPEAQRELADIRKQLNSPAMTEDAGAPARIANRVLLRAIESRLLAESEMLEQEQLSQSVREDFLQAQHDLLQRRVENAEAALGTMEAMSDRRLTDEAARVGLLADRMPENIPEDDEAARGLAVEVQALAREFEGVVYGLVKVKEVQSQVASRMARLVARYESVQEELQVSAGGKGMAQILLDMKRHFPDQVTYIDTLTNSVPPLDSTRLAALQARTKLRDHPDVAAQFSKHPSDVVEKMVIARHDVLEQLRTQYGNLTRALAALEVDKKRYMDKAEEVRAYASEQLFGFGMREAPPVSLRTLAKVPDDLAWLFQVTHWTELWITLRDSAMRVPLLSTLLVVAAVVLYLLGHWIGIAIERAGAKVRRVSTDRYVYTLQALLWTALAALPFPLLFWFAGSSLARNPDSSGWVRGISEGLEIAAPVSFGLGFVSAVCRMGGLGDHHFRWSDASLTRFRHAFRLFALVYIPALLLTFAGIYEEQSDYFFTVGRLSFMVAHVCTAFILWHLLNFSDGVLATFIREQPKSLIARWRYLWFPLILLYPLALVIIAGMGYIFTAIQLSFGLLKTAAYVIGGTILYRLVRRWFRMKQRRLALAEALAKRRARENSRGQDQYQPSDLVTIDPASEESLDLVTIDEQTRDLLRLFFGLGVAAAILISWSDIFPVIGTLDAIAVPLTGGLTLLELLKGILIVVVTYIGARNFPGLLELAVLRATTIDAGTRHAISTLFQYTVIAIGFASLFTVLSVDWTKLGWIAAALSVGIGFGLQEVVANFICGLIVLFERPIRVGDVVTIDGQTGTVTKIRIRATTITNAERQEFVIPNKTLITKSLLNWTMNAGLNRVSIRVEIACESDPDKARAILLTIAREHPLILDEPAPSAIFEGFGKSSLNLALFVYLAALSDRSTTITELHTEIAKRFAAAGIEIPNPQMDLHLYHEAGGRPTPGPSTSG